MFYIIRKLMISIIQCNKWHRHSCRNLWFLQDKVLFNPWSGWHLAIIHQNKKHNMFFLMLQVAQGFDFQFERSTLEDMISNLPVFLHFDTRYQFQQSIASSFLWRSISDFILLGSSWSLRFEDVVFNKESIDHSLSLHHQVQADSSLAHRPHRVWCSTLLAWDSFWSHLTPSPHSEFCCYSEAMGLISILGLLLIKVHCIS